MEHGDEEYSEKIKVLEYVVNRNTGVNYSMMIKYEKDEPEFDWNFMGDLKYENEITQWDTELEYDEFEYIVQSKQRGLLIMLSHGIALD